MKRPTKWQERLMALDDQRIAVRRRYYELMKQSLLEELEWKGDNHEEAIGGLHRVCFGVLFDRGTDGPD